MESLLDLLLGPWAVREEALPSIRAMLRGAVTDPDFAANAEEEEAADLAGPVSRNELHGGIAVLSIRGTITPGMSLASLLGFGCSLNRFRAELREAVDSDECTGILLDVNSPGGYIDLVQETGMEIRAAREVKPVVAVANTRAASAAYWLASQASSLSITPSGEVGSIGVFTVHEDWTKYEDLLGIKTTIIKAGKYKVEANPFEPLSDEAKKAIQERVDDSHSVFKGEVAKGRGTTAAKVGSDFGQGRMLKAKDAVAAGMADRVETLESALTKLVRSKGGGGRKGLRLTDHIEAVQADVDDVTSRVADAVAQRADRGQQIAESTQGSARDLLSSIERLREALAIQPRNGNQSAADEAKAEFQHFVARESKERLQ